MGLPTFFLGCACRFLCLPLALQYISAKRASARSKKQAKAGYRASKFINYIFLAYHNSGCWLEVSHSSHEFKFLRYQLLSARGEFFEQIFCYRKIFSSDILLRRSRDLLPSIKNIGIALRKKNLRYRRILKQDFSL